MRLLALGGMDDAMALRRWNDRAKVHGIEVPDLNAYRQVVLDHLLSCRIQARSAPWKLHTIDPSCTTSEGQLRDNHLRPFPATGELASKRSPRPALAGCLSNVRSQPIDAGPKILHRSGALRRTQMTTE